MRVQFYAQLRDLAGKHEMDVDLPPGSTVRDLLEKIYSLKPPLRRHDKTILVGAGVEFVDRDYELKAGEEIADHAASARRISRRRRSAVSPGNS